MEGSRLQIQEELLLAKQSRQEGNEGRARVCARRAAGAAAQMYLKQVDSGSRNDNAIQSLVRLGNLDQIPDRIKEAVKWLVERVNEEHSFPEVVDLIHEARLVIQYIEGEKTREDN